MQVLFECDQCTYQEWRDEEDEPYLCPVCGYFRWTIVSGSSADDRNDREDVDDPAPAGEE